MKKKGTAITIWIAIVYGIIVGGYFIGNGLMKGSDMDYRFWVDALFHIVVWFVPVIGIGILLYKVMGKLQKSRRRIWRWIGIGGFVLYIIFAGKVSFFYGIFSLFSMTCDEKMPDGNLVVTVPHGFDSTHYYAEPVGVLLRKRIEFDENRYARSLSKVYGVEFISKRNDEGEVVYVSEDYPEIEIQIIRHGYTVSDYLETDFRYLVTSEALAKHEDIFNFWDVEIEEYTYGATEQRPQGYCVVNAPVVTKENKEAVAQAITEFIKTTLEQDKRRDGESVWKTVDGSIFLKIQKEDFDFSTRNIPFSKNPKYSWIYGEDITKEDILEVLEKEL